MHWYVSISYTAAATAAKVVLAILTVMHIYAVDYNLLGKMLPVFSASEEVICLSEYIH